MNVVFYSSNSNHYAKGRITFQMYPSCLEQWKSLKEKMPYFNFTVVMQKPGMFLFDDISQNEENPFVKYVFIEGNSSFKDFADVIALQKPDVAVAVTYWTEPFDWMSIKDSLIKEELMKKGIKTICHDTETAEICFDKWKTHQFLLQHSFNIAKGVYIHHEMFYAERNRNIIETNVYREYVFSRIEKLKFPLVIKDTTGLSSYGMDVVRTFAEAKSVLLSKKNNGDRLVEEYIHGNSFGCEIYGSNGNYTVTPPLINSVNQFGLTSPKQNVKLGPVGLTDSSSKKFCTDALQSEMKRLASLLNLSGIAQVDLIFSDGKWFIVEINSRLSGMTQTMASSLGISLYELILFSAGLLKMDISYRYVINLKFPLLDSENIRKLSEQNFVHSVNRIENHEARQLREMGYTEAIFGQEESLSQVMNELEALNEEFPSVMEKIFYENAKKLSDIIIS